METLIIKRFPLMAAILFMLSACSKTDDSGETANQRFIESMDWNQTHLFREIIVSNDEYSILSMSDSHVGSTKNLDRFLNIAEKQNATAVVMAGDLTTGKAEDYSVFEKHLPPGDSLAYFCLLGNHDLHYNGWKNFYAGFGSASYLFTVQTPVATDLFICLDTSGGTLGDMQLDWLRNILQTMRSEYRHCMVFTHNNFFRSRHTDSTNPLEEELTTLVDLFTKYRVDMVITGHDHLQNKTVFGITTYIIMDAIKDGQSNAGYFRIKLKNGNIEYAFEAI
jgi:predicted phosphodiesterase